MRAGGRVGRGATALLLGIAACGGEQSAGGEPDPSVPRGGQAWFVEEGVRAGLDFTHVSGFEQRFDFPEIMGSGVGLLDYDDDGWLDVYLVQSGDLTGEGGELPGNQLFRNRGDGGFEDVTSRAGVGDTGYGMGAACADYDGDGDTDIHVTNVGANVLYRNEGDGSFREVSAEAGVGHEGWGTSSAFGDFDGDGDLDLYVVNYLLWSRERERECAYPNPTRDYCSPVVYKSPAPDVLYENQGDGSFLDVSEREGVSAVLGNGLGIAVGDFDGDGVQNPYVANDMSANQLWVRGGDARLDDVALLSGCALSGTGFAESGMGVQAVDLEGDGDLDLFLSHLRGHTNTFYRNDGGTFTDATSPMGLAWPSRPFTGFGLGFADFDHDGDLDLYVANGHVSREAPFADPDDPYAQENQLFEQTAPLLFEEVSPRGGVDPALIRTSRGAAFGDLDNDGDVDAVVVHRDARVHLLRNQRGAEGHWVQFDVRDRAGRVAIGASVRLIAGELVATRAVDPAYGYLSSSDPRAHFGLGSADAIDLLLVRWPGGEQEQFEGLEVDALHRLQEGQGKLLPVVRQDQGEPLDD